MPTRQLQAWTRSTIRWAVLGLFLAPHATASTAVKAEAAASDAVARGETVVREWLRRDEGFHDTRSEMRMVLESKSGQTHERRLRVETLEVDAEDRGDKSLIVFDQPRDIAGTALLSFSHVFGADDQWVFLPALKRVKRIASNNKSGPFVGSEFAYEDLVSQELERYRYRWLREEACGELTCAVVEQIPRYDNSGYTRQVVWYDLDQYRQQRIDYYDRKNELLKTLTLDDYRQYLDRFWRAHRLEMVNHQSGKRTYLTVTAYEFQTGLTDGDFVRSRLERAR